MPAFIAPTPLGQCIFCHLIASEIPATRAHGIGTALAD